ncbi:MAG: iron-containing alcohol dehydrogenase [Thermomicrobiales bacterium]
MCPVPLRAFRLPGEVRFGWGASETIAGVVSGLGANRVTIVTDDGLISAGLVQPVADRLQEAGLAIDIFSAVSPNPRDTEVLNAVEAIRAHGSEAIVGLGGGSPIDLAKAAAGIVTNGGRPQDWVFPATFSTPPLPLVAIPTTAGTGSEVTRSSVINDTERAIKISLRDTRIAPVVGLVDPGLTTGLPAPLTASTGMDALTHAIEAYTCKLATPVTDALALHAMHLISGNLERAVRSGDDREARENMMMGSVIAGMAFSNSDVAAVHCIAEAIGGRYDTPHGVANSLFLPYLFAYNATTAIRRHADAALAMGATEATRSPEEQAMDGAAYLRRLGEAIGIPSLRSIPGIQAEDFPWIAAASVQNNSNGSNAREMDEAGYLTILEQAWNA